MFDLCGFPLWINLSLFIIVAIAIWLCGTRLTIFADIVSTRTGFAKAAMGFIILALITELPEIVTNSTGAIRSDANLVLNGMVGGIVMQTAILVIVDFVAKRRALTQILAWPINLLQCVFLTLLLLFMFVIVFVGDKTLFGHIGYGPILLCITYLMAIYLLWHHRFLGGKDEIDPSEIPEKAELIHPRQYGKMSTRKMLFWMLMSAIVILFAGIMLIMLSESIAKQTHLGVSFIGATLLATVTSLPELSTTIAAARIGAYTMAFSDIMGSNMIMILLLLPADLLYKPGLLINQANKSVKFALIASIVFSLIYCFGLIKQSRKTYRRLGLDSWAILILYPVVLYVLYLLR